MPTITPEAAHDAVESWIWRYYPRRDLTTASAPAVAVMEAERQLSDVMADTLVGVELDEAECETFGVPAFIERAFADNATQIRERCDALETACAKIDETDELVDAGRRLAAHDQLELKRLLTEVYWGVFHRRPWFDSELQ